MQKLYVNGSILTMNEDNLYCEALLTKDGHIQSVGSRKDLEALAESDCQMVDLKGACLMPSFIDPHSHLTQFACTLRAVHLKGCTSIADMQERIRAYIKENQVKPGETVYGFGYDHNELEEHRHPNRWDLDAASSEHPIVVSNANLHVGALNSLGLEAFGLDDSSVNPEGGAYGRDEQGHLTGYLEETAFMRPTGRNNRCAYWELMTLDGVEKYVEEAMRIYASYGITTAQEGNAHKGELELLERLSKENRLPLDMVAYADILTERETVTTRKDLETYKNHFRIGGYKLFLDGSPQGKTAWLSKPYENSGDYCGYPNYTDEQVDALVQQALDDNKQILIHCNGDAASQQMLNAFHHSRQKKTDTRPVMIHCQTLRPDQLPQLTEIGMLPSFFVVHVHQWGDVHYVNLGKERAENISCAGDALKEGLSISFHQDTPVLQPDMITTIWTAVNRLTQSGRCLGEHQRIPVLEALKAVTINAAYQYFEEDSKGTLDPGKLADMVILSTNPLEVDPMDIRNIQVLETIKEGTTIYKKDLA